MLTTTEVGRRKEKEVAEISPSSEPTAATEKPVEQTVVRDKTVGKRPLEPSSEKSSEVLEDNNGDEARKARFFRALASFCEARNELFNLNMNDAELEAAKVITESAMNNNNVEDKRGEKALKDMNLTEIINNLRTMAATKLYQDFEVVKERAVKKAKGWENRAEKAEEAEKAIGRKRAELYRDVEVAKNEHIMNLCKVSCNCNIMMLFKKAELYRDYNAEEDSNKRRRVVKVEKLLEDVKKAMEESWKNAVDSTQRAQKAFEDWNKALKDSSSNKAEERSQKALEDWNKAFKDLGKLAEDLAKRVEKAEKAM